MQISQNFSAPIINKTSAETVVVTPDKTTVVIGGLMQKTDSTQVNKVPLLGDIPVVGNLFKRTTKTFEKNELVIFMTPYIVEGTDHLEDDSINDVNHTDIPQEGFSGNDVTQFLDNNLALFPKPTAPAATATKTMIKTRKTTTITAQRGDAGEQVTRRHDFLPSILNMKTVLHATLVLLTFCALLTAQTPVAQQLRSKTCSQMYLLLVAIDAFEIDTGSYPVKLDALFTPTEGAAKWKGPYLKGNIVPLDSWGHEYVYVFPGKHNKERYDLISLGPDGRLGGGDDITDADASKDSNH